MGPRDVFLRGDFENLGYAGKATRISGLPLFMALALGMTGVELGELLILFCTDLLQQAKRKARS
jgi:hypothetical protein